MFVDCPPSLTSATFNLPPGFTEVGSPAVTYNANGGAIISATVNIAPRLNFGANQISATVSGPRGQWQTNIVTEYVTPFCPWSVSLDMTRQESLSRLFPTYNTGVGMGVLMDANPDSMDWNGAQIEEMLTTDWDACPSQPYPQGMGTICNGHSIFTVGTNGNGHLADGTPVPVFPNAYWDDHYYVAMPSVLNHLGLNGCAALCIQQYVCGGDVLGRYTIGFNFSRSTLGQNHTPVTVVQVTEESYPQ